MDAYGGCDCGDDAEPVEHTRDGSWYCRNCDGDMEPPEPNLMDKLGFVQESHACAADIKVQAGEFESGAHVAARGCEFCSPLLSRVMDETGDFPPARVVV